MRVISRSQPGFLVLLIALLLCATILAVVTEHAEAQYNLVNIVKTGDPTPLGGTFSDFGPNATEVSINDLGQVAFVGQISGGSSSGGIFLSSSGTLTTVVAIGDPTPMGGTFSSFSLTARSLNNAGQVGFMASVTGGSGSTGWFLYSGGMITKIAGIGDPTQIGGTISGPANVDYALNDFGDFVFNADVTGGSSSQAIFLSSAGGGNKGGCRRRSDAHWGLFPIVSHSLKLPWPI